MNRLTSTVAALLVLTTCAAAQNFNFPTFTGTEPITLGGSASFTAGALGVSPGTLATTGSAYHSTPLKVDAGFDTTFSFSFTVTSGSGGSGMALVIHNDPAGTTALGAGAHGMGYGGFPNNNPPLLGIGNSLVLEIDTFLDSNKADPSASHISLHTNGTGNNDQHENFSIGVYNTPTDVSSGAIVHTVRLRYVPGTLDIFYDGSAAPVLSVPYDFATGGTFLGGGSIGGLSLLNGDSAYIGFTASSPNTTAQLERHDVLSWSFSTLAPPAYPGNSSDFDCGVIVNGVIDGSPTRVISVNPLDTIGLHFDSPTGGTDGQFFSAFYQLFFTGSPLISAVIPGETPPGGFWLDTTGTNPAAITAVVPYLDGIGFGGPTFLAPVLLPGGSTYSFVVPPVIGGQAISLMLQAVIVDPGLNSLNLGIDDCIELQVN